MNSPAPALVIEIDDQIEALLQDINAAPHDLQRQDIVEDLQQALLDSVLGPFGLSAAMLRDTDGGNITTVHNFEKGVTANEADQARHDDWKAGKHTRKDIDRNRPLGKPETAIDAYTGRPISGAEVTVDHVVPVEEFRRSARSNLAQTLAERQQTANHPDNLVHTHGAINSSKGQRNGEEWSEAANPKDPSQTNAERFGIDPEAMKAANEKARATTDRIQDRAVLQKQAKEFALEGGLEAGKLAARQVVGLILADLVREVAQDVRFIAREGLQTLGQARTLLENRAKATLARLSAKWADYLRDGALAGLSGLLSSLMTLLVNSFITTAKNIVTMIREGILAIVRAARLILNPAPSMTGPDTARAVLQVLAGAGLVVVGLAAEELVKKVVELVPLLAPFAGEIAGVVTAMVTGLGSLLILFAFDQMKNTIAFRNKQLADVHRGQAVTLLEIKKTAILIDRTAVLMTESDSRLRRSMAGHKAEVAGMRIATDASMAGYARSVNGLSELAKLAGRPEPDMDSP